MTGAALELALSELPPRLEEIARAAGLKSALLLARECGGTQLYVPRDPRPGTMLVAAVGIEAARIIARLYPGENIEVPLGPISDGRKRRREISRLLDSDLPVQEIARRLHCHSKTVRRVKARERGGATFQHDLFKPVGGED